MDLVACKIALGGDSNNVIYRGPDTPVSWPEIRVLQHLHGEDNVFDCEYVDQDSSTTQVEKMRLLGLYGAEAVNICYPGSRPMMEMEFPGDKEPIGPRPSANWSPTSSDGADAARAADELPPLVKGKRPQHRRRYEMPGVRCRSCVGAPAETIQAFAGARLRPSTCRTSSRRALSVNWNFTLGIISTTTSISTRLNTQYVDLTDDAV
jgi:hypothetical protein